MRLVAPGRDQTPGEANASGRASLRSPMLAAAGWRKFSQQACPLGSLKNYGNRRLGPRIAVGMPIAGHPPHRSGQARFEHPAPTSSV
jgi:hypothetical protein